MDGLRGIAAVAVVLTHLVPLAPSLHPVYSAEWQYSYDSWQQWLVHSPLHFWWMGEEAVFVFFVLSGFVLTLAAAGGRG